MYSDDFYRYIYPNHNGWQIKKNNIHYGWYDDIRWALFDRDRLERCNWDFEEFVWLNDNEENKYLDMILPPHGLKRWRQNIYPNGKSWRVSKRINGILINFGTFQTIEDAIEYRNKLIENGWKQ